jgi:hypothetical protein
LTGAHGGPANRRAIGRVRACTFEAALDRAPVAGRVRRLTVEAGFFEGLALCEELLAGGEVRAVALVAADSCVTRPYLAEHRARAASPWDADLPLQAPGVLLLDAAGCVGLVEHHLMRAAAVERIEGVKRHLVLAAGRRSGRAPPRARRR